MLFLGLLFVALAPPANAFTQLDPITGTRISEYVTQSILGSPPLPSLTDDKKHHLKPQASYLVMVTDDATTAPDGASTYYGGAFKGGTAGLGYAQNNKQKLSLYGFGLFNRVSGSINSTIVSPGGAASTVDLTNMVSSGYSLFLGGSYRLWSEKTFPLLIGLLAGPFASKFTSDLDEGQYHYSASALIFGAAIGIQAYLKVFGIKFNPYYFYYTDFSNRCRRYDTNAPTVTAPVGTTDACTNKDPHLITLAGSFHSYGIDVGVFGLSFGAYSRVVSDAKLDSIQLNNFTLSYTFDF